MTDSAVDETLSDSASTSRTSNWCGMILRRTSACAYNLEAGFRATRGEIAGQEDQENHLGISRDMTQTSLGYDPPAGRG
jgi:hypothetical protein